MYTKRGRGGTAPFPPPFPSPVAQASRLPFRLPFPLVVLVLMLSLPLSLPPAPYPWPASAAAARADPAPTDPTPAPAGAPVPVIGRTWPVGQRPAVVRAFEPPPTAYARGHRGVDLAALPGAPVRAVAAGRVSYAGRVAGRGVISVELAGTGLRTTYEPVRPSVAKGTEVAAGQVLGAVETTGSHCAVPCLHWGLRRERTYLDPLTLLPPWLLRSGPSRLLPVLGVPLPA